MSSPEILYEQQKEPVAVVVPIYKSTLSKTDSISLTQTYRILDKYPIYVVCPDGIDLSNIIRQFPKLIIKRFDQAFFSDIKGYNRLMLSADFYKSFDAYKYILICQLDAYIFRDELYEWCQKGYDYIGAPWIKRNIYNFPILSQAIKLYVTLQHMSGLLTQFDRYGKIGNGGLSLRKVQSHINQIENNPEVTKIYSEIKNREHLHNEDTYWAMIPKDFIYPSEEEAMLFSYDKYPELSFKLTGGKTPFGCHGWTKHGCKKFWCKNGDIPSLP